jgi:GTP-binding protein HflX
LINKTYKSIVCHPDLRNKFKKKSTIDPTDCINEAVLLANSLGIKVQFSKIYKIDRPNNSTLFNNGQVELINDKIRELNVDFLIIDGKLSPIQQRNLEKRLLVKVIDRTRLILDIFEKRAVTREGALQVELAQLEYQKTRLVKSWTHLERQRGSLSFIGGPGESQLEIDRRLINGQIIKIKKKLRDFKNTRNLHRNQRDKKPYFIIALVGYTNAGKSTLFNKLTGENALSKNMLFATLDTKMKKLDKGSLKNIILTDTVGFISELPTELIMSFRSTLEEINYADLIINVRDISSGYTEVQNIDVINTIKEIGKEINDNNYLEILNKVDLIEKNYSELIKKNIAKNQVMVSAATGQGMSDLYAAIEKKVNNNFEICRIKLKYNKSAVESWLHDNAVILDKKYYADHINIKLKISKKNHARFQSMLIAR